MQTDVDNVVVSVWSGKQLEEATWGTTQHGTSNPGGFDNNFMIHVVEELMKGAALLNLIVTDEEELVRDLKV